MKRTRNATNTSSMCRRSRAVLSPV
jgi:hypothetical protein